MHVRKLYQAISAILFLAMTFMVPYAKAAQVALTWTKPTTKANGTPLTNLAGYKLYYGRASGTYGPGIDVGNVTFFTLSNLEEGQTYYFAVTAYDSSGNESKFSNEKSVTIPPKRDVPTPPADDNNSVALSPKTVTASASQVSNVPANTHDGNPNTRWSAEGDGQWIVYDLGSQMTVSQVAIAWYQGNQRQSSFAIEVSSNGTNWTEVYSGESSGKTVELEPYSFTAVAARYVRIVGYGNTANQWNSITEVEIYSCGLPESEVALPPKKVTASASQAPNIPANTHDGNPDTRWSAEGDGQWIMYDLGSQMTVSQVAIAWHQGNPRKSFFATEVSSNGTNWTEVYSGESSGKTLDLEPYCFAAVAARYVRIVGYGNSDNRWNSITEVKMYSPQNAPQPTCDFANLARCAAATASSEWSASYAPSQAIDGNNSTRWNSASGDVVGAWLALEFGTPTTFDTIVLREAIARITGYTLQYWDGATWQPLVSGTTIGTSKTHTFAPKTAQRLRLLVTSAIPGSSSVTPTLYELEVYGQ
jgi:F5/8 type C domain